MRRPATRSKTFFAIRRVDRLFGRLVEKRLDELPGKTPKWKYSEYFALVDIAYNWKGLLPSQLGLCAPEEDLIVMSAYLSSVSKMRQYEEILSEKK